MKKVRSRNIDTVFVLVIFSAFAFSVLMVLMLGAGVYKNISDISRDTEGERTVLSYVRTKVRNFDDSGSIRVEPFDGLSALCIAENIGGREYKTVIYCYDGWLCELFSDASMDFSPGDGMRVARIDDLRFEQQAPGIIKVMTGDMFLLLSPRSAGHTDDVFNVEGIAGGARNDGMRGGAGG